MIKIDNITDRFSSYISNKNTTRADVIIGFIVLVFSYICWKFYIPFSEMGVTTIDIDRGYSAKQYEEGRYYVVDSGHLRLICFDENSEIRYMIDNISDGESEGLYISDFCVDNGLTYMSVCEWGGMFASKEAILVFDKEKYVRTIVSQDYDRESLINKPSFHGITVKDNILRYVEAKKSALLIHSVDLETGEDSVKTLDYFDSFGPTVSGDFFDAVDQCQFNGEKLYILSKYGKINLINGENIGEVYSTKWKNEENRIPYRMAVSDNDEIYFIDMRGREVVQVNVDTKSTKTIFDQTDALTINLTKSGNEFLVVNISDSGVIVFSNDETETFTENRTFFTLNENFNQLSIKFTLEFMEIVLILLLLLLMYRVYIIVSNKQFSSTTLVAIVIMSLVLVVSSILCKIQVDEFSEIYRQEIMSKLENSAYTVVNLMPRETLNEINNTSDYDGKAYNSVIQTIKNAFPMNFDLNRQIYCEFLKWDKNSDTVYTIAGSDQSVGVYFPILDPDEIETVKTLYQAKRNEDTAPTVMWDMDVEDSFASYMLLKIPVYDSVGEVSGVFSLGTDAYFIQDEINNLVIEQVLSLVVVLLLVWFAVSEFVAWIDGKKTFEQSVDAGNIKALPLHFVRLLIFFIFAFANLSATFLPVWLMNNSAEFESNQDFMATLPFTINIFVIGIMSLVTPMLIKRWGMKHILTLSSIAAFYGNAVVFLIPGSYPVLFFGMLIEGIGNGIIMNATYILLTYIEDEEDKQRSFSVYSIASLAGGNFGFMLGSILAVLLSQRITFLIIALMWLAMAVMSNVILLQMKNLISTEEETADEEGTESISLRQFILNRPVLSFMILFQNPYILFSGFVIFFAPIFCEEQGYSEIVVSILMMIHAEAAVLSESNLSERITKLKGNMGMYIAYFLNISAVMLFVLIHDVFGLALSLIIMGIAAGFGITLEQMWFIKLKPSQQYGEDNAMSIYSFTENIGESLGPMVFARLMTLEPIIASVSAFCAVVGVLGFGHMLVNKKEIAEFNSKEEAT